MTTNVEGQFVSPNDAKPHVLRSCPFCGGIAELITRGNAFTKKRSAEVECVKCHTKQVTAAVHSSLGWCENKAVEKWNNRSGA